MLKRLIGSVLKSKNESPEQQKEVLAEQVRDEVAVKPSLSQSVSQSDMLLIDESSLFYSYLFYSGADQNIMGANQLEKRVIEAVSEGLSSPSYAISNVLYFPTHLLRLESLLSEAELDIDEVHRVIMKDPRLAVEVLVYCNSQESLTLNGPVVSIKQALALIDRTMLFRLLARCKLQQNEDIKPIYLRRFGAKIWDHTNQTAWLASQLANKQDADCAFTIGLIHDLGKIAIFKFLLDAFVSNDIGEQPGSPLFIEVMTSRSLSLTALLAKTWGLPECILNPLNELASSDLKPSSGMASIIWRANLISEGIMLYQVGMLDSVLLNQILEQTQIDRDTFIHYSEQLTH